MTIDLTSKNKYKYFSSLPMISPETKKVFGLMS